MSRKNHHKILTDKLLQYLASTYALYLKTQNFHWNVTGPAFFVLHSFFEKQYQELAEAIDLIAEQIRTFEILIPGNFKQFSRLSKIKDSLGKRNSKKMISQLLTDHLLMAELTKELITISKDYQNDYVQDMSINRLKWHEKTIWMLRSYG